MPNYNSNGELFTRSSQTISVLVVIDPDQLEGIKGSKKKDDPKMINDTEKLKRTFFMIASNARGIDNQGTDHLAVTANVGDGINFVGITPENNSDHAVIIYDIVGADSVLNQFVAHGAHRSGAVQASTKSLDGLPAEHVSRNFMSLHTTAKRPGKAKFLIRFALYKLDKSGQKQELGGYYQYDPEIIVK